MSVNLGDAPPFVLVRDMNYIGEVLYGKWDGKRYYVLDDGDCYTPERLVDAYGATFLDEEPATQPQGTRGNV